MNVPFLQNTTFTGSISTLNDGTSQKWNEAYSLVQSNSASWSTDTRSLWGSISGTLSAQTDLWSYLSAVGTSNFDIPTLTNYLSTNSILLCSLNVNGQILSAGIPLHNIFLTTEYLSSSNVLLSALTVTTNISAQGLIYSRSLTPNLPVPKIVLTNSASYSYGNATAEYLTGGPGTWGVGGLINLTTVPYVRVLDFTQEDLNNNQIFIEMVIFKRKQRKGSWNVEGFHSYVAPAGNATPPWGNNFWQRSGDQSIDPENPKLFVTRYNHLSVTNLGQTIPLTNCLNGHFVEKVISYLDPTSNDPEDYRTINCLVPSSTKKNVLGTTNLNRRKFPYVRTYKPLYIAFRYICWLPNNNNGRGQIISGPLSPTIKVANSIFPFDIDHYQSSLKGFPVCNLNPIFDKTSFTCKFC